ncbi:PLP-dependent aminotransferase family protein [Ketobacter sp.]|uniref:aminotransferase-like domain-containing protein n=1 Tax=Ketobacter sp. TaxID=2083498 RepID=UPI000F1AB0D9|nr:PLP-dependent aminotransferase family protein [Ketobacter sp.]RLT92160.1 MAG: PLP-dependent aminotransferase family protein [Ketobacter sp.]
MEKYRHWQQALHAGEKKPAYVLIADLIEADIEKGFLQARDRLPPLRDLAALLSLNYTTVTRAYKEAANRGLIDSHPGSGSYVKGRTTSLPPRNGSNVEMTMNMPPELEDHALQQLVREDILQVTQTAQLNHLLRYQDFGGTNQDKEAGVWLLRELVQPLHTDRILVCPGIHSTLVALLSLLCGRKGTLCVGHLVYPGLKAIAAQLGVALVATPCDQDGPLVKAIEALCKAEQISALYLNPTLQNPTTHTMGQRRREAIADLALRYNLPIIEDDAYGLVPATPVPAIANLAPELTYYINGLSKCFGAGCRSAYLVAPSPVQTQRIAGALRALSVMASPITTSLATRWIQNGTLDKVRQHQRQLSRRRQQLARQQLGHLHPIAHADGFHLWLPLPRHLSVNPSDVAVFLRNHGISAVSSAAFCTDNNPPDAIRMCLGGPVGFGELGQRLNLLQDVLQENSNFALI